MHARNVDGGLGRFAFVARLADARRLAITDRLAVSARLAMAAWFEDSAEVELRVGASAAAGVAALPMKRHRASSACIFDGCILTNGRRWSGVFWRWDGLGLGRR